MVRMLRNLFAVSLIALYSFSSIAIDPQSEKETKVESKKQVQEARTLDGKKVKACDFRISLS